MSIQPCMPDGRPAPYLMTGEEVLEFLRLKSLRPDMVLWRLRKHGTLSGVQVGRHVRFRLSDVLVFLDKQQAKVPR